MITAQIDALKRGPWPVFGSTDGVGPAWHFDAQELLNDDAWESSSVEMADGSFRVYPPRLRLRSVSLRGVVVSDHTPAGAAADGSLTALEANITALKAAVADGRGTGDGRLSVTVKVGSDTVLEVVGTAGVRIGERGGFPAEATAVVTLSNVEVVS